MNKSWIAALLVGLLYIADANSNVPYRYELEEENGAVAGRISLATRQGDRVIAILETVVSEGGEEAATGEEFLEIVIRQTQQKATHLPVVATTEKPNTAVSGGVTASQKTTILHPDASKVPPQQMTQAGTHQTHGPTQTGNQEATILGTPQSRSGSMSSKMEDDLLSGDLLSPHHPLHQIHLTHMSGHHLTPQVNKRSLRKQATGSRSSTSGEVVVEDAVVELEPQVSPVEAPEGKFVVHGTEVFMVDSMNHNYIVVNNVEAIGDHESIEFYVYLVDNNDAVISNPLPFIVYVDREPAVEDYPATAAVFAGVLVLCVIFMAVLIPLVTRAKRRKKQGKPLFKLGSHASTVDLESAHLPRNKSEPNWYGNNTYTDPEQEVANEQLEFSRSIRRAFSTQTEPPSIRKNGRGKEPLSERSSSGIDVAATDGASGDDDALSQRL